MPNLPIFTRRPTTPATLAEQLTLFRFGLPEAHAPPRVSNDRIVVPRDGGILELFPASQSFRWMHQTFADGRLNLRAEPNWDQSALRAEDWYRAHVPPHHQDRRERRAAERYLSIAARAPGAPVAPLRRVLAQVATTYANLRVPLIGPGAKTQVSVDATGRIVQAYHFWHPVMEGDATPLAVIPLRELRARLSGRHTISLFDDMRPRLVYYLPPPTRPATVAVPFYEWLQPEGVPAGAPFRRQPRHMLLPAIDIDAVPEAFRREARELALELHTLI